MLDFNFFLPTRLIFGAGRLADLATTPHLPPGTKAMIVMGQSGSMLRHGHLGRVQGYLGERGVATVVSDTVTPNPESDQVDEAAARARELGVDFIVGLGGGSSLDAAKGVAFMARNPGSIWGLYVRRQRRAEEAGSAGPAPRGRAHHGRDRVRGRSLAGPLQIRRPGEDRLGHGRDLSGPVHRGPGAGPDPGTGPDRVHRAGRFFSMPWRPTFPRAASR